MGGRADLRIRHQGEIIAVKIGALLSCPSVRALLITRTPLAEVTAGMHLVWFVNVCIIATLVDQGMAVVGFAGLQACGLELDASCGLGAKYVFNAVPFLKQASSTERSKMVMAVACAVFLFLCIALGEA